MPQTKRPPSAIQLPLVEIPPHPGKVRRYGIPYEGSKSFMARDLIDFLPPATHFYDCFAGGCSVSHCAILSGKYRFIHINDIGGETDLFLRCIKGEAKREKRIIDKAAFHALKGSDAFVRRMWSYCGNGRTYLWRDDIAEVNIAAVRMLLAEPWQERRRLWMEFVRKLREHRTPLEYISRLPPLEKVENMVKLEGLRPYLDRIFWTKESYADLVFEEDSVIYCDIPYSTADDSIVYKKAFDHAAFYSWALKQRNIFISEYTMPEPFVCVYERPRKIAYGAYTAKKRKPAVERVFTPPPGPKKAPRPAEPLPAVPMVSSASRSAAS